MYRIIEKRNYLFALSLALLIPGVIGLVVWGLRLGIDFTGGSVLTIRLPSAVTVDQIATSLAGVSPGEINVQSAGEASAIIRLPFITSEQHQALLDKLKKTFPAADELSFETVGPTIGGELKQRAITALALVLLAIIIYITWAFRKVSVGPVPSWVYGLSALLALVHDVLMVIGAFAVLGHFFNVEINALFVTALLTVLGFSVHDTIVVFDRVRERLRTSAAQTFEAIVNESLNQTLIRSINTSFTTVLVLVALYLFGGQTVKYFVLALIIGITSGTYSSIFVASPLLVVYERWKARRR
ncbi:MAG: protein translocase subunit SecF [Candidatus Kerfeldbacteria bacterium]|nr:protein translocase subunit SecF [Candidatus Kerfeldbacteria bacterium]